MRPRIGIWSPALGSLLLASTLPALGAGCGLQSRSGAEARSHEADRKPGRSSGDAPAARWSYLIGERPGDAATGSWDGRLEGLFTDRHESGQKKEEGEYVDYRREGRWACWYESGRLRWRGTYRLGVLDGVERGWYENGQPNFQGARKDGERDGTFVFWHESGEKWHEGPFRGGKKEGFFRYWHSDGSPDAARTGHYRADVRLD